MISVGKRLEQARLARGMSLEDVARAIKIKATFLQAIEKGDYRKLPSPTYAQGFVKNYATFLELPKGEITALFRREFDEKKEYKVLPDGFVKQKEYPLKRIRYWQTGILLLFLFLAFFAYLLFQYRFAIFGPSLQVDNPKENAVVHGSVVHVTGQSDGNATVTINNTPVYLDSTGHFAKDVDVFSGDITLQIKAQNRFGKQSEIDRHIQVKN